MSNLFAKLTPFIFIGIAIVALSFGIILLAYLFFFGAIIGFILFIITFIRNKFFPIKPNLPQAQNRKSGRTIDSDDWTKL